MKVVYSLLPSYICNELSNAGGSIGVFQFLGEVHAHVKGNGHCRWFYLKPVAMVLLILCDVVSVKLCFCNLLCSSVWNVACGVCISLVDNFEKNEMVTVLFLA